MQLRRYGLELTMSGIIGSARSRTGLLGTITAPLQPAFLVQKSAGTLNNVSNNDNLPYSAEIFDQGNNFDTSNFTFTAPVSGRYQLNVQLDGSSIDASARMTGFNLVTSNRTYIIRWDTNDIFNSDTNEETTWTGSWLCDMDASDTAKVTFYQVGGSTQYAMTEGASFFSGFLVA